MLKFAASESTRPLPLTVSADASSGGSPDALLERYPAERESMEARLREHGALLFRGFGIDTEERLSRVVRTLGGEALGYVDGNSPRRKLSSGVYTSTEYPPEFFISLHNELSYSSHWPSRVFFCCAIAPEEGGETPLADSRRILQRLPDEVRDAFVTRKVKYIRNLHGGSGFGPSWQATFETGSRDEVSQFCATAGTEARWNDDGGLTITQVRPATRVHPATGEEVWFNQADQFHPSTHPPAIYESLLALYGGREELMPQTATFGDGSPIEVAMLDAVRQTVREEMRLFRWQRGDLLMVDNMLVAHGRRAFAGPRKILVSMT
ncbi:MAG TPA: TauD/TfdA family dioxygenase [Thermoanaerobaculia bacterium]|nr:TauD/TfdA family dioxygenase [Thermoanaerobaculia bacterium]